LGIPLSCYLQAGQNISASSESPLIEQAMTDYWEPYTPFIPSETHGQSKAETFTVEGFNSGAVE